MGRVTESFPIRISDLKTAYSATGTRTLRAFLAGAGITNTYTATIGGWLPSSGTIRLSDFRGATDLNVTWAGSNTGFILTDTAFNATALVTLVVTNNGRLSMSGDTTTAGGVSGNYTTTVPNSWLRQDAGTCSTSVTGLYQVKLFKVAGTSGDEFNQNNVWQTCSTSRTYNLLASGFGPLISKTVKGRMVFRRTDNLTELANVYVEMNVSASGDGSCPTCCFTPDTMITMADKSTRRIDEIQVGDEILVYNQITATNESQKVSGVITRVERPMYQYVLEGNRILNASEEHPLYVIGKGYSAIVPVGNYKHTLEKVYQIQVGDMVQTEGGNAYKILEINPIIYPETVYTLENCEFYANGVLVY